MWWSDPQRQGSFLEVFILSVGKRPIDFPLWGRWTYVFSLCLSTEDI
jgi:hypothetical protein